MASRRQSKSVGSASRSGTAEACPQCGKPLAADQRYCVNCGHRRGEPRVDVDRYLASDSQASADGQAAAPTTRQWSPLLAVAVLALLAGMLLVGVLIGKNSSGEKSTTTTTTTATGTGTAPTTATGTTPTVPTTTAPTTSAPAPAPGGGAGTATGATPTTPGPAGAKGKVRK